MKKKKNITISQVNSVSFLIESSRFSYIIKKSCHDFEEKVVCTGAGFNAEKIFQKLEELKFFEQKYSYVDVSVLNNQFTLIPAVHFEESLAETFLNYTVPFSSSQGLRFNLVPQFDLVLAFYYPEELENIFSKASEKVRITHSGFKFLSKIKGSEKRDGIFLNTSGRYFETAVVENEKLLLYNIYPYAAVEDIIYFLRIISKNTGADLLHTDLYYFGRLEEESMNIENLIPYFRNIYPGTDVKFERVNYTILDLL